MKYFLADTKESLNVFNEYKLNDSQLVLLNHYAYPGFDESCYIFANSKYSQNKIDNILNFSTDWYHDTNGADVTLHNGFSWGAIIGCSMLLYLPYLYREYLTFKDLSVDIIWISENEALEFKQLMQFLFSDKIKTYKTIPAEIPRLVDLYTKRSLPLPRSDFKLSILASIKKILLKKKPISLFVTEGSLLSYFDKQRNIFYLNTKLFKKSVYQNAPKTYSDAVLYIPPWLTDYTFYQTHFLSHSKYKSLDIDSRFLSFFSIALTKLIEKQQQKYLSWMSFYLQLFKNYTIKEVIFPGERIEFLSIGIEIAKLNNAKTIHITDGFAFGKRVLYFYYNSFKSLFNSSIVFNQESLSTLTINNPKLDEIVLENKLHPMLKKANFDNQDEKPFDIIIFAPISLEYSLSCLPDYGPVSLDLLVKKTSLLDMKIAIKFKNEKIINYYKDFFTDPIYQKIPFLTCPSLEALNMTRVIITGVSTTIAEAEVSGIPCFVYEAIESGYTKDFLSDEFNSRRKFYFELETLLVDLKKILPEER